MGTFYPGILDSIWWDCVQCSTLVFLYTNTITVDNRETDNGLIRVEPGKKTHRKEGTHNDNKVRLFN